MNVEEAEKLNKNIVFVSWKTQKHPGNSGLMLRLKKVKKSYILFEYLKGLKDDKSPDLMMSTQYFEGKIMNTAVVIL